MIELLGTSGCHLCDVAERMVRRIAPAQGHPVQLKDIALDDVLVEQYGMRIPVLRHEKGQELSWPFDEEELMEWLANL